jgi:hypothetical protein
MEYEENTGERYSKHQFNESEANERCRQRGATEMLKNDEIIAYRVKKSVNFRELPPVKQVHSFISFRVCAWEREPKIFYLCPNFLLFVAYFCQSTAHTVPITAPAIKRYLFLAPVNAY